MSASLAFCQVTFAMPELSCRSLEAMVKNKISQAWQWSARVLNKHTDLISSVAILAITTCLLAGKIFESIPKIVPRLAKVIFDFGGIIWLNVQVRDLIKSGRDLSRAIHGGEKKATLETAAKVLVKGVNVILTCAIFGGSVVAACGFPQAALALALVMRPIGLSCLGLNIITDIRDYFVNEALLREFKVIEERSDASCTVAKVMTCFLEIIANKKVDHGLSQTWQDGYRLADRIVRQLHTCTVETFQEMVAKNREDNSPRLEALKLFYAVKDGIVSKQAGTKANLSLTTLGYVAMGICRAFPDSILEMGTRWCLSVLYTEELVRQKLSDYDLAKNNS